MSTLPTPRFDIRDFHYAKDTKVLSQEISTLSSGRTRQVFGRVWDDACDEGLTIQGYRKTLRFAVDKIDQDREGDIAGWWLAPVAERTIEGKWRNLHSRAPSVRVLVVND